MDDAKDDTTPLEYLVAGLVVLMFGLLYYLFNHGTELWSGHNQNEPNYSNSSNVPKQQQGLASWLETSAKPEAAVMNQTLPTETVVPEPDTKLADAITSQQKQTARLHSSLNDELASLKNEVAQHKAEISQLKQAAAEQSVKPEIMKESAGNELQQLMSGEKTNKAITLDKIYFNTGSARLKTTSQPQIEELAQQLMKNEKIKILIRGHSDNTGSVQQNSLLSLSRSGSMKKALTRLGINPNRIQVEGVGPIEPIASNETAEGREKNRRIELIIIK